MANKIKITNNKFNVNQATLNPEYDFYDYGEIGGISSSARASGDELIPIGGDLEVYTRTGRLLVSKQYKHFHRSYDFFPITVSQAYHDRLFACPQANPIKVDTDALTIYGGNDNVRYILNITNMRDNLKQVGVH